MVRLLKFAVVLWIMVLVAITTSGCSVFGASVGPRVAKAVNRYCQEPLAIRQTLRLEVNGMIQPNAIRVQCAGDPPERDTGTLP